MKDTRGLLALARLFALALAVFFVVKYSAVAMVSRSKADSGQLPLDATPLQTKVPLEQRPGAHAVQHCSEISSFEDHLMEWKKAVSASNFEPLSTESILSKVRLDHRYRTPHSSGAATVTCVMSTVNADSRAVKAYQLWLSRCDQVVVVTNKPNVPGVPIHLVLEVHPPTGDNNGWQRFRATAKHLGEKRALPSQSDFFLFVSDDSYVMVENLRKFLDEPYVRYLHTAGTPLYMGHRMVQSGSNAPFVSGSAVLLNRMALTIFNAVSENANCDPTVNSDSEDILIAACFRHHNIFPLNTQDVFGEDRFHMFDAGGIERIVKDPKIADWYPPYRRKVMPKGLDATSRYSIHFHGVAEDAMQHLSDRIATD